MAELAVCDHCGEDLPDEPIRRGRLVYCCEACAFEAARSKDCGGRTDTHIREPVIEIPPAPEAE
jgi:hypothetical protein